MPRTRCRWHGQSVIRRGIRCWGGRDTGWFEQKELESAFAVVERLDALLGVGSSRDGIGVVRPAVNECFAELLVDVS